MNTITVRELADELGVRQVEVERQVTRLCRDAEWGPLRTLAIAVDHSGSCLLFAEAADEIRKGIAAEAEAAA